MTAYATLNAVVRIAAAALLIYAAAQKLAAPRSFRSTLTALRVPRPVLVSAGVPLVELGAGFCLLSVPRATLTAALVAALGLSFATAGALALGRGTKVKCACFGQTDGGDLGPRQMAMLPLWGGVAALAMWTPDRSPAGPELAISVTLALSVVAALQVLPLTRKNREYMQAMVPQ
ncbi:MauE/DoxX family redox-associated membrane protein [Streptomyces melanogenes]|uniref:Methylamine utilisation protein MauE domain-containing protein n=1 Tax=Streptomyces melanogenes TaxID=67326 RepID=A0ABZ1XRB7_9ACTN|nr:MauE/DoxX family redox-associated membrane protein [Streptomyces melanogenes]